MRGFLFWGRFLNATGTLRVYVYTVFNECTSHKKDAIRRQIKKALVLPGFLLSAEYFMLNVFKLSFG
jgi:hypothetical protein